MVKLLLNSIISTPGAKFMTINIKYFYLNTPMPCFEYMCLKLTDTPNNFLQQYNLASKGPTTSWPPSTTTIRETSERQRVPKKANSHPVLDPQMASYFFLPLCGQLRREIQWKAKLIPSHSCAERALYHFPRLERATLPRS